MSEAIILSAAPRSGAVADKKDFIPAVVYGSGIENTSLTLKRGEFEKVFAQSGESGLVSLEIEGGKTVPVIVKDFQADPIKHRIMHVDFYMVDMKEKVTAEVTLEFVGEAPAVKTHGGIVVKNFDSLEIECLPGDLIQHLDIDLSTLNEIGDAIHVSDIKLPEGVVFKHEAANMIAQVVEPKKVVEEAPAAEAEATAAAGKDEAGAEKAAKTEAAS